MSSRSGLMYRIKTDIRQYKCETKSKVEKLIRNWVIRPNDLIYHSDNNDWHPIGEHDSFANLFELLEAQENAEPDTVVTGTVAGREEVHAVADLSEDPEVEEVTNVKKRPEGVEVEDIADANDSEATVVEEDNADADQPDKDDDADENGEADENSEADEELEEPEDIRETVAMDVEGLERDESESALEPPIAPEGVEPPLRTDEVTMMTEKTLDLLTVTDEDEASDAEEEKEGERSESEDAPKSEEVTNIHVHPDLSEDSEPTGDFDSDNSESEPDDTEDLEEQSDLAEDSGLEESSVNPLADATDRGGLSVGKRLGRHDLPEEFFATNEMDGPISMDSLNSPRLDELAELSSPSEAEDEDGEEAVEEADEVEAGDEGQTRDEVEADDVTEESDEEAAEDDAHDSLEDEIDYDEDDEDSFDEEEWEDSDTSAALFEVPVDHIEDPYAIPLPFPIEPNEDDVRVGLKLSTSSIADKDRQYPLPVSKTLTQVYTKTFDLSTPPPEDRSFLIVGAVVVALVMFVVLLVLLT